MVQQVEISTFDLRYESYRVRDSRKEQRLLAEIIEQGIQEPLAGVDTEKGHILLDGFKRYRCGKKLGISIVPYTSLGADEATGILAVLGRPRQKRLGIIEEACFVRSLKDFHAMSIAQIAQDVSRSKGWVSMRMALIDEMSDLVRKKIFSGAFPAYSYMYIVRRFMRMNQVEQGQVETFIEAVSGKKLSVREIEQLAHGYFRGPDTLRREITAGNITLVLDQIRNVPANGEGCGEFERMLLGDLELLGRYMRRVTGKVHDPRLVSRVFYAQAHLLLTGILSFTGTFSRVMREFHDQCANT